MTRPAAALVAFLVVAGCAGAGAARPAPSTTAAPPSSTTTVTSTTTTTVPPTTSTTTTTVPPTTTTLPAGPSRAVLIGDSIAYDLGPALGALLTSAGAGFLDQSYPGLGFSVTTDTWNWRASWGKIVTDTQPDVVIFLAGPWDAHDVTVEGAVLTYGSPEWQAWYGSELDDFVRVVHQSGAHLVWLTAPGYDSTAPEAADLDPVNAAVRAVAGRWADVEVVDTDAAVDGPDGASSEYLPGPEGPVQVRKGDGLHFCPSGAARVAAAVLPALQHWWSLAPTPGWDAGAWRQDERYVHPLYNTPCG